MTEMVVPLVAVLVNTLLLWALPGLSRPTIFFAVTVSPDFRKRDVARRWQRRYRTIVILAAALCVSAMVWVPPGQFHWGLAILGLNTVCLGGWAWVHHIVRAYGFSSSPARRAGLAPRDGPRPGAWLVAAGPFVMLAAAALLLHVQWEVIPDRFPTRWSLNGTPVRWTTKSFGSVFGALIMGTAVVTGTLWQTWSILARTRHVAVSGPSAAAENRFRHRSVLYGIGASYLMAGLFAYLATRKVVATDERLDVGIWAFLGAIIVLGGGFMIWMVRAGQGGQRQVGIEKDVPVGDATPDDAWKAGVWYFNPADPSVFVEKRMGLGWTVNFGNRWTWVFLAAVLLGPVTILLLTR